MPKYSREWSDALFDLTAARIFATKEPFREAFVRTLWHAQEHYELLHRPGEFSATLEDGRVATVKVELEDNPKWSVTVKPA